MTLKKIIFLCIVTLQTVQIFGQIDRPNVIPPSPEAAAIFKSEEVPVSLYTGLPNITIPIFNIEARGLTIPINISYHSRGNRVDEIAPLVGMGWSLNYGGMISRQIRGSADEDGNGYLSYHNDWRNFYSSENTRDYIYNSYTYDNNLDFIPDQYYFSANGISGKFLADVFTTNNTKYVVQKYSNIKIESTTHGGMKITDGDGNRFYYGTAYSSTRDAMDTEITLEKMRKADGLPLVYLPTTPSSSPVTAWHLMEIITSKGEVIEFFYEDEYTQGHPDPIFCRRSFDIYNTEKHKDESQFSKVESKQNRLVKIKFEKGTLVFTKSATPREDLENGYSLESIKLYKSDIISEVNKIKEFNFSYEYTNSPDDENQQDALKVKDPLSQKRMFLKSLQTKFGLSSSNDTLPSYRFKYNSTVLPSRHSTAQDIWGYYNGKNNGRFLKFTAALIGTRAVDTLMASAGILEEITYPEGGKTKFYYEHNKVLNLNFPKKLFFTNPNPLVPKSAFLTHIIEPKTPTTPSNRTGGIYRRPFTVTKEMVNGKSAVAFFDETGCGSSAVTNTSSCKFKVSIVKANTNPVITVKVLFKGIHDFTLPPGDYVLWVEPKYPEFDPYNGHTFAADLKWFEEIESPDDILYAAGKRIKKIEYLDEQGKVGKTKTYSYMDVNDKTSGRLLGLANFYTIKSEIAGGNIYLPFGSVPGSPFSTYQGNTVGYGRVTEYHGEQNVNVGKTVYNFSMTPDTGVYYEFPYHPPTDNEWMRGLQDTVTHYKRNGNIYLPVKKIKNKYVFADYSEAIDEFEVMVLNPIPIWKPTTENMTEVNLRYIRDRRKFSLPIFSFGVRSDLYSYKTYHFTGGTLDTRSTEVTDYFDNGSKIVNTSNYTYDYDEHYNAASVSQFSSDGAAKTTKYFYAGDSEMTDPGIADLKTKNIVEVPLFVQTLRDDEVLSSQKTIFMNWGNIAVPPANDPQMAPQFIQQSKGTGSLETKVEFLKVDKVTGNPLAVRQANGITTCYIWGYNNTQVIAKIENVDYSAIEGPGYHSQTVYNGDNEGLLISALNNIRTSLPNAMVTTFTYKPLIGVSTITNPNGQQTTYFYDEFNRLKTVKDHGGKILTENQYYYAPQN